MLILPFVLYAVERVMAVMALLSDLERSYKFVEFSNWVEFEREESFLHVAVLSVTAFVGCIVFNP